MTSSVRQSIERLSTCSSARFMAQRPVITGHLARLTILVALLFAIVPLAGAAAGVGARGTPRSGGKVFAWGSPYAPTPIEVSGISGAVALAGGTYHTLALKADGTVWAWGANEYGELGNGSGTPFHQEPVQVSGLSGVVAVAAGRALSLALKSDGTVWAWGLNDHGQLGVSGVQQVYVPVQVSGLTDVVAISSRSAHSLALRSDGTVWTWGRNDSGQLGRGVGPDSAIPLHVAGVDNVVEIAASGFHSAALNSDGTVWTWGYNGFGYLGVGDNAEHIGPVPVTGLAGVKSIAGNYANTVALRSDGTVYSWGWNTEGELGNYSNAHSSVPVHVSNLVGILAIAGGDLHSLALTSDGHVWAWGAGVNGQLGDGGTTNQNVPVPVSGLSGVIAVASAGYYSMALQGEGTGASWGRNDYGQLGNGTSGMASNLRTDVVGLAGLVSLAGGGFHSLALTSVGSAWAWGSNNWGELGIGAGPDVNSPIMPYGMTGVVAVAAGEHHNLALTADSVVWAWGHNENGQVGTGVVVGGYFQPAAIYTPNPVIGMSGAVAVAAGAYFSLALRNDGTVWSWGWNEFGQLGDGTSAPTSTPEQVLDVGGTGHLSGATAIAGGAWHSLALKSDGTVWAWGRNNAGQLGNNSFLDSSTPVQASISGVIAIAAGMEHSLALKSDGTVWAWGRNAIGQLGDGSSIDSPTPVQVGASFAPLTGMVAIACGQYHSVALKNDGTVSVWGDNALGQAGDGTFTTPRTTPVQVSQVQGAAAIAAGLSHTLALQVPLPPPSVAILANNFAVPYGTVPPTNLTYTVSPPMALDTPPTCTTTAGATSPAGVYAITCSGATKTGYTITYVTGTLTVSKATLTVTADNKTMLPGGSVPTLTASYYGLVNGETAAVLGGPPTLTTSASSLSSPGVYPINVSLGSLASVNYQFRFVDGTLTVDQSALGAIPAARTNFVVRGQSPPWTDTYLTGIMAQAGAITTWKAEFMPNSFAGGIGVPAGVQLKVLRPIGPDWQVVAAGPIHDPRHILQQRFGAGYASFAPEESVVQFVDPPLPVSSGDMIGLTIYADPNVGGYYYPLVGPLIDPPVACVKVGNIGVGQITTPCASGEYVPYALALQVNVGAAPADGPLRLLNNYFVTGSYVSRGTSLLTAPVQNGFATGTITIASAPRIEEIPDGAEPVAAFLYWQTLEDPASIPFAYGLFRGYHITGEVLGNDLPFSGGFGTGAMRTYRANVLPYLPVNAEGWRTFIGSHAVSLPHSGTSALPLTTGASLVVVYRVLAKDVPLNAVVIYDGSSVSALQQPIWGYYDATLSVLGVSVLAKYTPIGTLSTGSFSNVSSFVGLSGAPYGGQTVMAGAGAWGAVVLSTRVNDRDGDGLLDAWEAGPTNVSDFHYGQPGYYDAKDGSWVPLPGADPAKKDVFVQVDYMCSVVLPGGACDLASGHWHWPKPEALLPVQQAFAAQGINLHLTPGYAIPEEMCVDDYSVTPPRLCPFPNQGGVVGWKLGVGVLETWPRDRVACAAATPDCTPRLPRGRKDSYHYMVSAHLVAHAWWSVRSQTLTQIQVTNNVATVTTAARQSCPARVTITGAFGDPDLNGVYPVSACPNDTTFRIATSHVDDGLYPSAQLAEPELAIASGTVGTVSGFSDVGGAHTVVALGGWGADGERVNVQSGTWMHELGHAIGLLHGGLYHDTADSYVPTIEANCKPNYQSVMNYLFQIDLLGPISIADFSNQELDVLNEGNLSSISLLRTPLVDLGGGMGFAYPTHSTTSWYAASAPSGTGDPAQSHCDGTPLAAGETMYRITGKTGPIAWANGQDINFDGTANTSLRGYNDWANVDLRQIGATGSDFVGAGNSWGAGGNSWGSGGNTWGAGGNSWGGGGNTWGGGGNSWGSGGNTWGSGGNTWGAGGNTWGAGGNSWGAGGNSWGAGGNSWGSGGNTWGSGGNTWGGGGRGFQEINYATANSIVRPPRNVTVVPAGGGGVAVNWMAANFGNIQAYYVYSQVNGGSPQLIQTVPVMDPQATFYSYTDPAGSANTTYFVTTVILDQDGSLRQSTAPKPPDGKMDQTITFEQPPSPVRNDVIFTVSATSNSGLPVSVTASGACTISGTVVTMAGPGTCTLTASQAGDDRYNAAPNVTRLVVAWTLAGFYSPITMSSNGPLVWNTVKGGASVPFKFNIYAGTMELKEVSAVNGSISLRIVGCQIGTYDEIQNSELATDTGNSSLRYDSTAGHFIQNVKMPKTPGTCYVAQMTAMDGNRLAAYFRIK